MKIVVLGGAGKMGCIAVQDLANDQRVGQVIIADRDLKAAKTVAEAIDVSKVDIQAVDLADKDALVAVLTGADACLNATVYYFNLMGAIAASIAFLLGRLLANSYLMPPQFRLLKKHLLDPVERKI